MKSAGILLFRESDVGVEVLLAHPGGPFWARKDEAAWSIPKGEIVADEEPLNAARREFEEELGAMAEGPFLPLQPIRQPGGKWVYAWAARGSFDPGLLRSNLFSMEWPPRSGRQQEFPELDKVEWFNLEEARRKISKGQAPLLDQLLALLANGA